MDRFEKGRWAELLEGPAPSMLVLRACASHVVKCMHMLQPLDASHAPTFLAASLRSGGSISMTMLLMTPLADLNICVTEDILRPCTMGITCGARGT